MTGPGTASPDPPVPSRPVPDRPAPHRPVPCGPLRRSARRNDACGQPLGRLNARPRPTEPSLTRSIPALLLAAATLAALPAAALAQDRPGAGAAPPVETAPKPAADTKDPGKTATEAVTHPSAVPPAEGEVGTGKPPATGDAPTTGR